MDNWNDWAGMVVEEIERVAQDVEQVKQEVREVRKLLERQMNPLWPGLFGLLGGLIPAIIVLILR